MTEKQGRKRGLGRPFQKGQSGNPNGRPPNDTCLTALLRKEIEKICLSDKQGRTWKELIVMATMKLAMEGNAAALREVWERSDGKIQQPVTGAAGEPVEIRVVYADEN